MAMETPRKEKPWDLCHPVALQASVIMENVEQVVTCQGVAFLDIPNVRSWSELPHEPGNWTLAHELEQQTKGTSYREWLHLYDSSSVVVSINQAESDGEMFFFSDGGKVPP